LRLLLDTHIVLWRLTADPRLPKRAVQIMDEEAMSIDVSAISVWEVAIKWTLRKGRADDMPVSGQGFLREMERALIAPLAIQPRHAAALDDLPLLHNDPFDRLLLATARHEGMTLLTHDANLRAYGDFVALV
jgi:PIN domain nuclease of toxin-antitoxin system